MLRFNDWGNSSVCKSLRSELVLSTVLFLTACGGGGITSPTAPTTATLTSTPLKVAGWIKAFGVGGGVQNATVRIGSAATATTNSDGYFELDVSQSGVLPVAIEASGFHKSESCLDVSLSKQSTQNGVAAVYAYRDILPSNNDSVFDMNFFSHVFRNRGDTMTGTSRWVTIPTVELWTQEMECLETLTDVIGGGDIGICENFKATATVTDSNLKAIVQAIVNTDIPALTNNVLSGVSLRTKSHAAGTIFEAEKEYSGCAVPNTIVVAYIGLGGTSGYNGGASLANICWDGGGDDGDRGFIKSGFIVLGGMYPANRETTAHEMAHVLGMDA